MEIKYMLIGAAVLLLLQFMFGALAKVLFKPKPLTPFTPNQTVEELAKKKLFWEEDGKIFLDFAAMVVEDYGGTVYANCKFTAKDLGMLDDVMSNKDVVISFINWEPSNTLIWVTALDALDAMLGYITVLTNVKSMTVDLDILNDAPTKHLELKLFIKSSEKMKSVNFRK